MTKSDIDIDAIFVELGEFGRFQAFTYFLTFLPVLLVSCFSLSYIFTAGQLDYRCKVPICDRNYQNSEYLTDWLEDAVPYKLNVPSKCRRYQLLIETNDTNIIENESHCSKDYFNQSEIFKCNEFIFKNDEVTILNEFNLTCEENEWKLTMVGTIKNSAELIMLPISGMLSDRYGRRTMLICAFFLTGILGLTISFSVNYWMFLSLEFITALVTSGSYMAVFILGMELVGPQKRVLGGTIIAFIFSIGQVLLGFLAMYTRKFRILVRILYVPTFLVLSYIWIIPESVRWLISKGRNKDAVDIIYRAAKFNNVVLSDKLLVSLSKSTTVDEKESAKEELVQSKFQMIINSKPIICRIINCCFVWFTNGFVYYGLSVNAVAALDGNKYVNFILVSFAEVPAIVLSYFLMQRVGRKWALSSSMILSGLSCLASEFIPTEAMIWRLMLFLVGKCTISISFTVMYVYTTEMFPTNLRQSLMGICSALGFIGSMSAPQTPLLIHFMPQLPLLLFGGTAILSGLLVFLFPETFNIPLPDTIEEAENIGKKNN